MSVTDEEAIWPQRNDWIDPGEADWADQRDIRNRPAYRRAMGGAEPTGALRLFLSLLAMILVGGVLLTVLLPLGPFGWVTLFILGPFVLARIGAAGIL